MKAKKSRTKKSGLIAALIFILSAIVLINIILIMIFADKKKAGKSKSDDGVSYVQTVTEESEQTGGRIKEKNTVIAEEEAEYIKAIEEGDVSEAEEAGDDSEEENIYADPDAFFYISEIPDSVFAAMQGKSYKEGCPLARDELRYIHILYYDFNELVQEGELVCNEVISQDLLEIFRELYENRYALEKVRLIDEYDADDEMSMRDNNTSCFNYRSVPHSTSISKHGYGLAIDINPFYNPYIVTVDGKQSIEPENSAEYADRTREFDHKIDENDLCYKLFTEHGFTWGGSWKNSKDYQHFVYEK